MEFILGILFTKIFLNGNDSKPAIEAQQEEPKPAWEKTGGPGQRVDIKQGFLAVLLATILGLAFVLMVGGVFKTIGTSIATGNWEARTGDEFVENSITFATDYKNAIFQPVKTGEGLSLLLAFGYWLGLLYTYVILIGIGLNFSGLAVLGLLRNCAGDNEKNSAKF